MDARTPYQKWLHAIEECDACTALYEERGQVPEAAICENHLTQLASTVDEKELAWWKDQIEGGKRIAAEIARQSA